MPQSGQVQPKDANATRKFWRGQELTDRQEVRDAGSNQGGKEEWSAPVVPVARTDCQRHAQDGAKKVDSGGRAKLHRCSAKRSHSLSHIAVRGALSGARLNSAASRVRSSDTSIS